MLHSGKHGGNVIALVILNQLNWALNGQLNDETKL